ncbi:MAG TPA: 5-(carboxyamino)imidazole ribonucleotide synthase [Flavobacteriales bacterium]|nr:5-(carboxyamino)imidazole ribonucleotide synthase [Flavobacteriales bacterium]
MGLFYQENFKLGILGGGQLGRMLLQETVNLNITAACLDPDANAPCKNLVSEFVQGNLNDYQTVVDFGSDKSILTIEIENVNVDALMYLEARGTKVFPQPRVLKMIKDKGLQKQFYNTHNIPTAPFELVNNKAEAEKHLPGFPYMQKLRVGGYDGKGVHALRTAADLDKAFDAPCVLEKFVDFEREIAVIVARNERGETASFPVVDMDFNKQANLVEYLFSPSEIDEKLQESARNIAVSIIEKLEMVGVLAVEMFLTKTGELLVNEIAPRPHNSGHHTIEANKTSQYGQHLRAILNLPLGSTDMIYPSVMVNVLGEPGYEGQAIYEKLEEVVKLPGTYVHLYGKKITKPFRKMGHVTIVSQNLDQAKRQAKLVKQLLKVKA